MADPDWISPRLLLLRWYAANRRDMPWRVPPGVLADPYRVLVSETMLQQTQVVTVIGYFHRFIKAFPTLQDLADADEQRVLWHWQGLGYYRRARSLHAAASVIVRDFGGRVPESVEDLMKLPGVGRYTAGAVASIAYGKATPVVDGNVARVLARILGESGPVDDPRRIKGYWAAMTELVKVRGRFRPGDVNQAVMELGATTCTPRAPRCLCCPVRDHCRAYASGNPEAFGGKGQRKAPTAATHHVIAVQRGDRYLFEQRGDTGLWAGLWQLPALEDSPKDSLRTALRETHGVTVAPLIHVARFTHVTTHRRIGFEVYTARYTRGRPKAGLWRRLNEIGDLPMSNAQKRVIRLLTHPKH